MTRTGRRELIGKREWEIGGLYGASLPLLLFLLLPFVALLAAVHPTQWIACLCSVEALQALRLTLETTLISTALCLVGGLPVALLLARREFRGREFVAALVDLPISVPPVVTGVCLLLALGRMGLIGRHLHALGIDIGFSTTAVVLAQVMIACPFFIKPVAAGLEAVDPNLADAARVFGASPWTIFWNVTLPMARPALLAGTMLAWARALSEFGATMMFAGNFPGRTQTLPLAIMSAFETDLDTAIAMSTISVLLSIVALGAARFLARCWERER